MAHQTTWRPPENRPDEGAIETDERNELPFHIFAFPDQRKMPMTDANHVRNAVARFNQVEGVSDDDRALAWANIEKAAKHWDVELTETSWKEAMEHNG